MIKERKLAQDKSVSSIFQFSQTPRSRDPSFRRKQKTMTNKELNVIKSDLISLNTPSNISKNAFFQEEKENYWKQRVDLLIYEKKNWIKERQKFHQQINQLNNQNSKF